MDLPDRTRTPEIARRHLATSPLDMVAADILAALLNRRPARLSAVRAAPAGARARKIAALRLGLRQDRARADAACADVVAGYRDYIEALQAKAEKTRNALVAHLDIGHPPAQAWKGIAIEALIALAEARPLTHLAAHWGISEAAIRKKLKANGWTARGAGVRKPCPPQRQR